MRRKPAGLALAVDAVTIDLDIEDAASARNQRHVEAEFLLDRGRQTGGLWFVVSLHAEGDPDLHDGFRWKMVTMIRERIRVAVVQATTYFPPARLPTRLNNGDSR